MYQNIAFGFVIFGIFLGISFLMFTDFKDENVSSPIKKIRPNLNSPAITIKHEAGFGGDGIYITEDTSTKSDVPAMMLITNKNGNLIPCNYQFWLWGGYSRGFSSRDDLVLSCEPPINSEDINVITVESFKSSLKEGGSFYDFIRNLVHNPPSGVQFIKYDGVDEVILPQEDYNFFGINIAKKQMTSFMHRFSLCRLRAPLDKEYENRLAEKKRQVIKLNNNLERLEMGLLPSSPSEYLNMSGQKINSFDLVYIEHSEENTISSKSPSIDKLVSLAKKNFVKKAPYRTERIIAVTEEIVEIPETFWVRGKLRITYHGIAFVPNQKNY